MAVLASVLIAAILIGIVVVVLACTRTGRKARQGSSESNPVQPAPVASSRSDLQGPHHPAKSPATQKASTSTPAPSRDADRTPGTGSQGERRAVEHRINQRLDEIEQLIEEDEEDLADMERLMGKSSRRERRRNRRRPKQRRDDNRDDDFDQFDAA